MSCERKWHEVAHVKDGNTRVGWLLKNGGVQDLTPVKYVTDEQFNKMVHMNQVQYFVPKGDRYDIGYTKEELVTLRKLGASGVDTLSGYLKNDICLQKRYLDAIGVRPYAHLMSTTVSNNMVMVTAMVFTNDVGKCIKVIEGVNSEMPGWHMIFWMLSRVMRVASNYFVCSLPADIWKSLGDIGWNVSAKGLKTAVDVLADVNTLKGRKAYNTMLKNNDLQSFITDIERLHG